METPRTGVQQEAWVVWVNTDLTEGRGTEQPRFVCRSEGTARRLARGAGVQGTDARVTLEWVIRAKDGGWVGPVVIIEPTREDEAAELRIGQRRAALRKATAAGLTDEDIAALTGGSA